MLGKGIERFISIQEKNTTKGTEGFFTIFLLMHVAIVLLGMFAIKYDNYQRKKLIEKLIPLLKPLQKKIETSYELYHKAFKIFVNTAHTQLTKYPLFNGINNSDMYDIKEFTEELLPRLKKALKNSTDLLFINYIDGCSIFINEEKNDNDDTGELFEQFKNGVKNICKKLSTKQYQFYSNTDDYSYHISATVYIGITKEEILKLRKEIGEAINDL